MKRWALGALSFLACASRAVAAERFPPPQFTIPYKTPHTAMPAPPAEWLNITDALVLLVALLLATYLVLYRRSRSGIFVLSIACLAFFGFYRHGCICSIGAIQNVALCIGDPTYTLSISVGLVFLLPLIFALFAGRIFCSSVCPLGALQDIFCLRPIRLPKWLEETLGLFPFFYLGLAILCAATGSSFLICTYDPFVAFFRLSGSDGMLILGALLLLIGVFVGRPYCRFLCPYGGLLRGLSLFSRWRATVTPAGCIQCRLCEDACPFGALHRPGSIPAQSARRNRSLLALAIVLTPILIGGGAWLGCRDGDRLSRIDATVRLADRVYEESQGMVKGQTLATQAFQQQGRSAGEVYWEASRIQRRFRYGGIYLGAWFGLIFALKLLGMATRRRPSEYEADVSGCVDCGRCYLTCPVEHTRIDTQVSGTNWRPFFLRADRPIWIRMCRNTAIVAALFCVFTASVMGLAHLRTRGLDPLTSPKMIALQARLVQNPGSEPLKQQIRLLDLKIRTIYFVDKAFTQQGVKLLIFGLLVLIISLELGREMKAWEPTLQTLQAQPPAYDQDDPRSLPALLAFGIALAASLFILGSAHNQDLGARYATLATRPKTAAAVVALDQGTAVALQAQQTGSALAPAPSAEPGGGSWGVVPGVSGTGSSLSGAGSGSINAGPAPSVSLAPDFPTPQEFASNWPVFRGPGGMGIARTQNAPSRWNGVSGSGILWKTAIPLPGENSAVVWGNRVFVSGATDQARAVYCLDTDTGKILWTGSMSGIPGSVSDVNVTSDTGYAAPTMATDGRRAYAIFANGDVAAFTYSGQRSWALSLGKPDSMYGYAASLTLYKNRLIIQSDQGGLAENGESSLIALDTATGKLVWRVKRPVPDSWCSPILINDGKQDMIITDANPWVIAYNPNTGAEIWRASGLSGDVAPTPTYGSGLVFSVEQSAELMAIRPGGHGDITKSGVVWTGQDGLPDIVSPLVANNLLFLVTTEGTVTCYDALKGGVLWSHDYPATFRSSPTLVGTRIYLTDESGVTHFFAPARTFQDLGSCPLGEGVTTSPAFVGKKMFLRGKQHLYCIGSRG